MKQRSRSKSSIAVYGNECTSTTEYIVTSERISDQVPGPGPCTHEKLMPYSSTFSCASKGGGWIKPTYKSAFSTITGKSSNFNSLNWSKLPTSTAAGLIQILAEIDDTVAIFTKKFWTSLSYGSVTWGVLPFVSDLRALATAIKNLSANLQSFSYEDSYQISDSITAWIPGSCVVGDLKYQGTVKYTGTASIPDFGVASDLLALLDRIGLHPDLATAWDLLPMSFIVDYFLPIGDYLESFRQGGWIKAVYFSGWCSFSVDTELTVRPTGRCGSAVTSTQGGSGHVYSRVPASTVLFYQPEQNSVQFGLPSPKQLFNTLYVLLSRKR